MFAYAKGGSRPDNAEYGGVLDFRRMVSLLSGVRIDLAQHIAKRHHDDLKNTDTVLTTLPAVAIWVLWMLFIVMLAILFARLVVNTHCVTNCALMGGNANDGKIKVHFDSSARHL